MKAIILAAGHGSRLLPLTLTTPKCLVAVGGRAILDHQLDAVAAAGFDGAVIVGGYRIDQVAAHLMARDDALPTELVFNPFWAAANSIGSVWAALGALEAPFALMNGDTLFETSILRLAIDSPGTGVKLVVEQLSQPGLDDMLVETDDDRVVAVGKQIPGHVATDRSLGLIVSTGGSAYADALRAVIGEESGIQSYHHAVVRRVAEGPGVTAVRIAPGARWQEVDRPEDIDQWQRNQHGDPA
ncbi:phosphocholine cytidylyltransferase family protein [Sphingomonas sp. PB2P19]|uniref:phosphocholine cytidylyltransferase family protein n=1 Tax=Sphingomonas rhamnosi TaxID=3096156 RepID=UPI002FC885F4